MRDNRWQVVTSPTGTTHVHATGNSARAVSIFYVDRGFYRMMLLNVYIARYAHERVPSLQVL
jgi:hypothetical protein